MVSYVNTFNEKWQNMQGYIAAIYASVGQRQKFITIILIYNLRQLFHMIVFT